MRAQRLPAQLARLRLPGRTVRVRLTVLYGILFVISGAVLLAIASGVAVVRSSASQVAAVPNRARPGSALAQAQAHVRVLQAQLQSLQPQPGQPGQDGLSRQLLIASLDRKSTRLNSSHYSRSRMPSSA